MPICGTALDAHLYVRLPYMYACVKGARLCVRCKADCEPNVWRVPVKRWQETALLGAVFSQATYFGSSTSDAEMDFSRSLAGHGSRYICEGIDDVCRKAGRGEGKEAQRGRLEDRDTFVGDLLNLKYLDN